MDYCIINKLIITIVGERKKPKEKNNNKQTRETDRQTDRDRQIYGDSLTEWMIPPGCTFTQILHVHGK